MALSNFQDVVVLASDTLSVRGQAIVLGTDAGAKSFIFQNDQFRQVLAANPSANETVSLPDASGTVGLVSRFSAGTTAVTNGQLVLSNSNNITFGLNGSTLTASVSTAAVTRIGGISAGTQLGTSGTILFSNNQNITWGMSGSTRITASAAFGGLAAGTQTGSASTIVFSNSNNVSFGMSGSTQITASAAFGGIAAGTQTGTSGSIVLSNSNGVSFGMSNSSVITASISQPQNSFFDNEFNQASFSNSGSWNKIVGVNNNIAGQVTSVIVGQMQLYRLPVPDVMGANTMILSHSMSLNWTLSAQPTLNPWTVSLSMSAVLGAAVFTINGSTAGLVSSVLLSSSDSSSQTGTTMSTVGPFSISLANTSLNLATWVLTPGDYMVGIMSFASLSASVSGATCRQEAISAGYGFVGSSVFFSVSDSQFRPGVVSTIALGSFPATFHVSNITDSGTYQWFRLYGT